MGINGTRINTENVYRGSPALVAGWTYKGHHTSILDLRYLASSTGFYRSLSDLTSQCHYSQGKHYPKQDKSAVGDPSDSWGSHGKPPVELAMQQRCPRPGCGGAGTGAPAAQRRKRPWPQAELKQRYGAMQGTGSQ